MDVLIVVLDVKVVALDCVMAVLVVVWVAVPVTALVVVAVDAKVHVLVAAGPVLVVVVQDVMEDAHHVELDVVIVVDHHVHAALDVQDVVVAGMDALQLAFRVLHLVLDVMDVVDVVPLVL